MNLIIKPFRCKGSQNYRVSRFYLSGDRCHMGGDSYSGRFVRIIKTCTVTAVVKAMTRTCNHIAVIKKITETSVDVHKNDIERIFTCIGIPFPAL